MFKFSFLSLRNSSEFFCFICFSTSFSFLSIVILSSISNFSIYFYPSFLMFIPILTLLYSLLLSIFYFLTLRNSSDTFCFIYFSSYFSFLSIVILSSISNFYICFSFSFLMFIPILDIFLLLSTFSFLSLINSSDTFYFVSKFSFLSLSSSSDTFYFIYFSTSFSFLSIVILSSISNFYICFYSSFLMFIPILTLLDSLLLSTFSFLTLSNSSCTFYFFVSFSKFFFFFFFLFFL